MVSHGVTLVSLFSEAEKNKFYPRVNMKAPQINTLNLQGACQQK